jgi:IS5 family transposase
VSVDRKHKFIRKRHISTAKEHDTHHMETLLDPANTSRDAYFDKGYIDQEREQRLSKADWRMHIQRKAPKGKSLSACQQRWNKRIASPRARVEHYNHG